MKRKIAMRMTQEQFESIKDRLPDFESKTAASRDSFTPYLINHWEENNIPSIGWYNPIYEEIHETFNADIFLEACGVEVEKVFTLQDFQYRTKGSLKWTDYITTDDYLEYRLKPQPNYNKEIEALQQKAKENGMNVIINFEKL